MEIGGWYAFGSEDWPGKLLETCRFNRSEDALISLRHVPTVTRSKRYLKRKERRNINNYEFNSLR